MSTSTFDALALAQFRVLAASWTAPEAFPAQVRRLAEILVGVPQPLASDNEKGSQERPIEANPR
jgi:hypothetical protein